MLAWIDRGSLEEMSLDWVHCNVCYTQPRPHSQSYFLSSCGHIACDGCRRGARSPEVCPECSKRDGVTWVKLTSRLPAEVAQYFTDPSELLRKLKQTAEFQSKHQEKLWEGQRHIVMVARYLELEEEEARLTRYCQEIHLRGQQMLKEKGKGTRNGGLVSSGSGHSSPMDASPSFHQAMPSSTDSQTRYLPTPPSQTRQHLSSHYPTPPPSRGQLSSQRSSPQSMARTLSHQPSPSPRSKVVQMPSHLPTVPPQSWKQTGGTQPYPQHPYPHQPRGQPQSSFLPLSHSSQQSSLHSNHLQHAQTGRPLLHPQRCREPSPHTRQQPMYPSQSGRQPSPHNQSMHPSQSGRQPSPHNQSMYPSQSGRQPSPQNQSMYPSQSFRQPSPHNQSMHPSQSGRQPSPQNQSMYPSQSGRQSSPHNQSMYPSQSGRQPSPHNQSMYLSQSGRQPSPHSKLQSVHSSQTGRQPSPQMRHQLVHPSQSGRQLSPQTRHHPSWSSRLPSPHSRLQLMLQTRQDLTPQHSFIVALPSPSPCPPSTSTPTRNQDRDGPTSITLASPRGHYTYRTPLSGGGVTTQHHQPGMNLAATTGRAA